jgi:hypothetical protein
MTRSFWRTGVLVAAVFVMGVVTGGLVMRAVQQRRLREIMLGDPAAMRTRLTMFALERRLDLTPAQRAEAERLLTEQESDYRVAVEACRPRVRALRRDMATRLAPALEPAQRASLDELVREGERAR